MMQRGSSLNWQEVLKEFTDGQTNKIDAQPLLDYFQPLYNWLDNQNLTNTDWDCESYIDEKKRIIKPYGDYFKDSINNSLSNYKIQAFLFLIINVLFFKVVIFLCIFY